jgi:hypothetical protein
MHSKRIRFPRSTYSFSFQTAFSHATYHIELVQRYSAHARTAFRGEPPILVGAIADFNRRSRSGLRTEQSRDEQRDVKKGAQSIAIDVELQARGSAYI